MGRIQTPITGISTTSAYEEGAAYSLVNLRPKNGALHPVAPRKVMQELSQKYDIVFVHQNNDYKNWLGVINDRSYSSVYWDILSEQPKTIQSYIQGKIHSVQQIGNTVSLITSDNIYYLFYQNNNYTFLGELPTMPAMSLRTSDGMSHAKLYFVNEYGSGTIKPDNFLDSTKGLINKAIDALINGWTDNDGNYHEGQGLQLFDACFIRYGFRLYDGSITKHSPPICIMPVRPIVGKEAEGNLDSIKTISYDFDSALRNESCVDVYGYRIYIDYDFTFNGNWQSWKDIIKSVDIFMSAPIGISNIENVRTDMPTTDSPRTLNYNLIKGLSPEAIKSVSNTSSFYFIKSIDLGTTTSLSDPDVFPTTESDISKMENLIFQEVMSDDNFSNHKYGAEVAYSYNNRLHLANVKTTFFEGFQPDFFMWFNTSETAPGGNPVDGNYNGYLYKDAQGEKFTTLIIETEIQVGSSIEKVYNYSSWALSNIYKMFFSAFISYPDPRAKRITIYNRDYSGQWTKLFSCPLEPHNLLNLAFYINDGIKPITANTNTLLQNAPDTTKKITLSEPNKIKVSELSNPLSFPNINTYQAGNGTVLAMATNAMNVSDRNFGQYPLYIFTTQGIWTLNIGSGEVVYSSQTAPTYTEAPTTSIVCSTPFGVVFTTQRGLQIINGQSVEFISPQLEQEYLDISMELPEAQCKDVIHLFNDKSFKEYLLGIENIIYNPHESELIICDRDSDYNYVLNLSSQSFYKSTERIELMVENIFPQLLVVGANQLKNYSTSNNPETHICLILRPLTFGTVDIKNLERIILRGLLINIQNVTETKKSVIMVHHSNDGVNFPALRGLTTESCNRRDYDMGLFASSKFRQFMFSFAGIVDENSKIQFLDTQIRQEYNNTKMR